jgi:hypothetical protein
MVEYARNLIASVVLAEEIFQGLRLQLKAILLADNEFHGRLT